MLFSQLSGDLLSGRLRSFLWEYVSLASLQRVSIQYRVLELVHYSAYSPASVVVMSSRTRSDLDCDTIENAERTALFLEFYRLLL
jgi:hypothetical protein